MTGRARLNLVLFAIVAGLAAVIALAPPGETPVEPDRLSAGNAREVSRIRLHSATGDAIELRRANGGWRLVSPFDAAANAVRVNTLLTVLGAPVRTRIDAPLDSLGRYGLVPPRARLELDDVEILFGDTEPIHGRRYLLYDGRVALIDDAYFSHLASSAANYVDPALLERGAHPSRIDLPGRSLVRDGDAWRREPMGSDTGGGDAEEMANAWRGAEATAVRPYESSLDWRGTVRVELPAGEVTFDVARTEYEVILGRRDLGIQYHLTKGAGARLLGSGAS